MKRHLVLVLLLLVSLPLFGQKKQLTLEAIYDPDTRINFSGAAHRDFRWFSEMTFAWPVRDSDDELVEWRLYDVASGTARTLIEREALAAALQGAGVPDHDADEAAEQTSLVFDPSGRTAVIEAADDLYLYTLDKPSLRRLTRSEGEEKVPGFSPDGKLLAFVRNNDLYVLDLASGAECRLTTSGATKVFNGILDWVYEEEIYGRGKDSAYWWSPDSSRIALLQLDDRQVPDATVVDHIPYRQELDVYPYPKAGDPNPLAQLFIAAAAGGELVGVDSRRYNDQEHLIVGVSWNHSGSALSCQVQNREQTWLDLLTADPRTGASTVVLRERTPAWVDPLENNPAWLGDGTFLWQSERSGWRHVYHYRPDGALIRQVTSGEWEVRDVHGVDERRRQVYFSGTERSPIGQDVYRTGLDGRGLKRLSPEEGTHNASFNPSLSAWVDRFSDIRTPTQIRVRRNDGSLARVVDENRVATAADFALPQAQFLHVKTRDGFPMEAMIIRPPDFDPTKRYPVFQYLYGGPHSQEVRNAWRGQFMLFNQLLAQKGIIVWMCDNRTASGKGAVSTWPLFRQFGASELRDIEDGLAWLRQQPGIDGSRVLLSGWSYGGFMVSYALTRSKSFTAGIAGGPVTDWRDYDSVYTERFLGKPENNLQGYKLSSPRFAAADLNGSLLLIHGTIDDNVHVQNTIQFAYELQKAGKPFEMMLYPKSKHGVRDKALVLHMQETMLRFIERNLLTQH